MASVAGSITSQGRGHAPYPHKPLQGEAVARTLPQHPTTHFPLGDLPQVVFREILAGVPMDQWSKLRLVCKAVKARVDEEGLLNKILTIGKDPRIPSGCIKWKKKHLVKNTFYDALFHQKVSINIPLDLNEEDENVEIAHAQKVCKKIFDSLPFISHQIGQRFHRTLKRFEIVAHPSFPSLELLESATALNSVTVCRLGAIEARDFARATSQMKNIRRLQVAIQRDEERDAIIDFAHLSKLKFLQIGFYQDADVHWTEDDINKIGALSSLEGLILKRPLPLTEQAASAVSSLPLRRLQLNAQIDENFDEQYFEHLDKLSLPHLESFTLFGSAWTRETNDLLDENLAIFLENHPHIKTLDLSNLPISDKALAALPPALEFLNVSNTRLTLAGLAKIRDLPHLKTLYACDLQQVHYLPFLMLFGDKSTIRITATNLAHTSAFLDLLHQGRFAPYTVPGHISVEGYQHSMLAQKMSDEL